MPRERRARVGAHQSSAKLSKRQFAVQENAVETVEVGTAAPEVSGQEIIESLNQAPAIVNKKAKHQLKHEAFVDRVRTSTTPYSNAQRRRFNRRQREQVGGGLDSIEAVISTLVEEKPTQNEPEDTRSTDQTTQQAKAPSKGAGVIGEGKSVTLTKAQRKRALELEKLRHPLILANPQYAANPFQTIRTHAQNTLEQHKPPSS